MGPLLTVALLAALSSGCDGLFSVSDRTAVDGPPVTRSEVILTADRYARVRWTMAEGNRHGVTCGGSFVSNYSVGDRIGMGYKWGGWNDIEDFLEKISLGYGTGTGGGLTYEAIPFECIVGVSCTGLVSRAWHLDHKYTLNYPDPSIERKLEEITHVIEGVHLGAHSVERLRKGDALINDYHVILFVYETRGGVPMLIDSSYEGVRFRSLPWSYLESERYVPIRYNGIVDDHDPPGTVTNPIVIEDGATFEHEGNTRDVVSMVFDRYSVAPGSIQTGPETVYELRLAAPATVDISVTEFVAEGIRHDIHLLASTAVDADRAAQDCLAKGDNRISTVLEAGVYYLTVDSGNDTPGEYTLRVEFDR
jgi:hypothetical protein